MAYYDFLEDSCQDVCNQYKAFLKDFLKIKSLIDLKEEFAVQFADLNFAMERLRETLHQGQEVKDYNSSESKTISFKYSLQDKVMVNFPEGGLEEGTIIKLGFDKEGVYYYLRLGSQDSKVKVSEDRLEDYLVNGIDLEKLSVLYYEERQVDSKKFITDHSNKEIYQTVRELKKILSDLS